MGWGRRGEVRHSGRWLRGRGSLVPVSAERSAEKRDRGLTGRRFQSFQSQGSTLPETLREKVAPGFQYSASISLSRPAHPEYPVSVGKSDAGTREATGPRGIYPYVYDF